MKRDPSTEHFNSMEALLDHFAKEGERSEHGQ